MTNLLTIITVTKNNLSGLAKTVNSVVANKHFSPFLLDHLVIDSHSSDGTVEYLEKLNYQHLSFISEPDDGIYHAMNKGLILSESCYIYYLNSGDVLNKDIDLLSVLEQFSNYDCITFPVLQYFGKDSYLRPSRRKPIASITSSDISHQGIVVKLEIAKSFPFDIDLPVSADSLWMRKIMNSNNFYFHNSILCHFELGGISNNFSFSNAVKLISSNSSLSYRLKVVVKMIFQSILGQRLFYRIFYFFKYDHTIRK